MTFLQLLIIAVVQGITEFLPISSSGHLILIPYLTEFPDQGPLIDVAVHVGSLLAIIVYFFKDVIVLARGGFASIGIGANNPGAPAERKLFWWIVLGTIPAVAFGLSIKLGLFNGVAESWFGVTIVDDDLMSSVRFTDLIAFNLIFYGLLLGLADWLGKEIKHFEDMTWRDGLLVGLAQALAIIPGTSRSGVTMTAARALGYKRVEAARFSFLLSIPAVAGAGVLIVPEIFEAGTELALDALIAGVLTFISAFLTMAFLMNFLKKASMLVFVVYRVALGVALFALF
ncbi:MAG: undecaprenyl-diphosphate phosphatase [Pseudomonadota bacterium]